MLTRTQLVVRNVTRRPLRAAVTVAGVALAVAAFFSILSFQQGYQQGLRDELDRLGAHLLVVPKGCPYDAASIALHGANWPCYLSAAYLAEVSRAVGVRSAAPAFMAAFPNLQGAATVYVGIDERMLPLKPGWRINGAFPQSSGGEILAGAEAARVRGWKVGQQVSLPEISGRSARVSGILQATQGSDDAFIYARLGQVQDWFQ